MTRTTILLPDELDRRLRTAARRLHRRQSDVIREALSVYLRQLEPAPPRSIGMGASQDATVSSEDIKDWVRDQWSRDADA